jgi:glycosyltransferase involved in cell wall biosynthesis
MEEVTVVIPTCNRPDLLRSTLTSVLRQRGVDLRVIVVDDGSIEDTAGVLGRAGDPRASLVRHESPRGVSAARNHGLAETTTTWVAFCDDDDVWSPEKARRQIDEATSQGRDWAYGGCVYVNMGLKVQGGAPPMPAGEMASALLRYNAMPAGASNVMVRTEVLQRLGGFDATLTHLPDWDLWVRLSRNGLPACVQEPLVGYRSHPLNASLRTAEMLAELDRFERRHDLVTNRARFHRHLAHLCLRSGRRAEALKHLGQALLRFKGGYSPADIAHDARLLRAHAGEIARHRFGAPARSRQEMARPSGRDPHAAWKAAAQAWLDELPR